MKSIIRKHIFGNLLFVFLFTSNFYSQNNTPLGSTFQELKTKYYKYETVDFSLAKKYAFAYLKKAKNEKDSISTANGYYYISRLYFHQRDELCLTYADSAIDITKITSSKYLPHLAYINKASFNYMNGKLAKSLENYIQANDYATKANDVGSQNSIKYFISVLKQRLGDYSEVLELSKEILPFFAEQEYKTDYLNVLFNLSSAYCRLNINDSSTYYNKLGYKKSIEYNDTIMIDYFTLNEGVNLVYKKRYEVALDSILKVIPKIVTTNDIPNIIVSHYYLGVIYNKQNIVNKSIFHLTKMDSLLTDSNEAIHEIRGGYEILIDHYKSKNDLEQQLFYVNKAIRFDSINYNSFKKLIKGISKKYDRQQLEEEKKDLKYKLDEATNNELYSKWKITFLIFIIIIALLVILYNYKKRISYKKRFEQLIKNEKTDIKENPKPKIENEDIGIPSEIVNSILEKLSVFEDSNEYLEKDLTRESLAQKLGTNTKYISKIINHSKNKNFRDYINELRVQYAVNELKNNFELRKYTIKSISEELGYKSVDSFSKAFKKNTGMQVSYFIKQLKNS